MSGASGKVLSAIQVTPESVRDGDIGRIRDGDRIRIDAATGTLDVDAPDIQGRPVLETAPSNAQLGVGRELFNVFRKGSSGAEQGAGIFDDVSA
jgi:phosphogluconate dehydratase